VILVKGVTVNVIVLVLVIIVVPAAPALLTLASFRIHTRAAFVAHCVTCSAAFCTRCCLGRGSCGWYWDILPALSAIIHVFRQTLDFFIIPIMIVIKSIAFVLIVLLLVVIIVPAAPALGATSIFGACALSAW
jgi:hypothetical protein